MISGPASGVRFTGTACNNSFLNVHTQMPASATQHVGIFVRSGAANVRINGCDVTGNLVNGVNVNASGSAPTNIFIKHTDFTGITPNPVSVGTPVTNLPSASAVKAREAIGGCSACCKPPEATVVHVRSAQRPGKRRNHTGYGHRALSFGVSFRFSPVR